MQGTLSNAERGTRIRLRKTSVRQAAFVEVGFFADPVRVNTEHWFSGAKTGAALMILASLAALCAKVVGGMDWHPG